MAMWRIKCEKCGWTTQVHYSIIDCVKDKQWAHAWGFCEKNPFYDGIYYDAHDSAFGNMCPKCKGKTKEEHRYFTNDEINAIKTQYERKRGVGR